MDTLDERLDKAAKSAELIVRKALYIGSGVDPERVLDIARIAWAEEYILSDLGFSKETKIVISGHNIVTTNREGYGVAIESTPDLVLIDLGAANTKSFYEIYVALRQGTFFVFDRHGQIYRDPPFSKRVGMVPQGEAYMKIGACARRDLEIADEAAAIIRELRTFQCIDGLLNGYGQMHSHWAVDGTAQGWVRDAESIAARAATLTLSLWPREADFLRNDVKKTRDRLIGEGNDVTKAMASELSKLLQ